MNIMKQLVGRLYTLGWVRLVEVEVAVPNATVAHGLAVREFIPQSHHQTW